MSRLNYLPRIDVLRAVAVLAVILYHLDSRILPGGFAGVDVFFVISGFVVSRSAAQRGGGSLRNFVLDFFARRVRRILPALIVCLLVTAFASALWIPPSWLSDNIPRTGLFAFFGASNFVLANNADSYFSPKAEFNPFTHTWSLGVEEQFYLLFPFLFYAWTRARGWRSFCAAMFALLAIVSFGRGLQLNTMNPTGGYYLLTTRFWELAAGVLLHMGCSSRWASPLVEMLGRRHMQYVVAACASAALAWTFLFHEGGSPPAYGLLTPVLATMALLLVASHPDQSHGSEMARVIEAPLTRIGQWSYSLYLWHWPVFVLFKWTIGTTGLQSLVAALALTFALAWASWRFVEQPMRAPPSTPGAKIRVIAGALAAVVLGSAAARSMVRHQDKFTFSTVARIQAEWNPALGQKLVGENGCRVTPSSMNLTEGLKLIYSRASCDSLAVTAPRIFAIGDSHALAYGPAFASYALQTGAEVTVYNNGGCPFLSLQPWREDNAACSSHAAIALQDMLPRLGPGDVVFLPSLRFPRFTDQWIVFPRADVESLSIGADAARQRQGAMQAAAQAIAQLRSTGARVILQAPGPVLKAPAFRCVDWWTATNEICAGGAGVDRAEFLSLRAPMLRSLEELAKADDGVTVFDPADALCPGEHTCSAFLDGKPLFFDGDHISAYGNSVLLPSLMNAIRQAVATD